MKSCFDTSDVVQESLAQLAGAETRMKDVNTAYLRAVTRGQASNLRRHYRAAKRAPDADANRLPVSEVPTSCAEPVDRLQREEQLLALLQALSALEANDRRVVSLRLYDEKTWPEIAAELSESADIVRGRYSRSVRQLRTILLD